MNDIEISYSLQTSCARLHYMEFTTETPNPYFANVRDIEPADVLENIKNVHVIDVRRPDEFHGPLGHIPSAQLITLDQLPQKIENLPSDKPIVFVCMSGGRSAQATELAMENGWVQVYNMRGGMLVWNENGYNVEK